jgi:hypothetical protein
MQVSALLSLIAIAAALPANTYTGNAPAVKPVDQQPTTTYTGEEDCDEESTVAPVVSPTPSYNNVKPSPSDSQPVVSPTPSYNNGKPTPSDSEPVVSPTPDCDEDKADVTKPTYSGKTPEGTKPETTQPKPKVDYTHVAPETTQPKGDYSHDAAPKGDYGHPAPADKTPCPTDAPAPTDAPTPTDAPVPTDAPHGGLYGTTDAPAPEATETSYNVYSSASAYSMVGLVAMIFAL